MLGVCMCVYMRVNPIKKSIMYRKPMIVCDVVEVGCDDGCAQLGFLDLDNDDGLSVNLPTPL